MVKQLLLHVGGVKLVPPGGVKFGGETVVGPLWGVAFLPPGGVTFGGEVWYWSAWGGQGKHHLWW